MGASSLRLRVSACGVMRADLTFPAAATARLSDMVSPDVAAQLAVRGIDPRAIADQAVAGGLAVGELFAIDTGAKQVRVWLE